MARRGRCLQSNLPLCEKMDGMLLDIFGKIHYDKKSIK